MSNEKEENLNEIYGNSSDKDKNLNEIAVDKEKSCQEQQQEK